MPKLRLPKRVKLQGDSGLMATVLVDGVSCGSIVSISPKRAAEQVDKSGVGWYTTYSRFLGWSDGSPSEAIWDREHLGTLESKAAAIRAIVKRSPSPELADAVR